MKKINLLFLFSCFICCQISWSQTIMIEGQIESSNDLENIHVINKTEQKFTITNKNGEFKISVKAKDTLVVSSIQNKIKTLVIDIEHILSKKITIVLEEQINQLDEVVVGRILTGNLTKDMGNVEGEAVTAANLGIPSYQGPLKTRNERVLQEASDFNPTLGGSLGGAGGSVGIIPLINAISGRTKKLKKIVILERKDALMYAIKTRLSKDFFASNPLDDDLKMDFFYFCSDDPLFISSCKNKSDFEILLFLRHKHRQYLENLKTKTD